MRGITISVSYPLVRPLNLPANVHPLPSLALLLVPALSLTVGCANHAFTPSARPMPLSPAQAPATGESDVQLDGNASGEVMGPGIIAGNVRYRRGLTDEVALTGDLGLLRVKDAESDENPYAGMSRVGVQVHGDATDEIVAAAFAGAGAGYAPAAGGWVSGDVGGMFSGTHRYVRPLLLLQVYASQPFATEVFPSGDSMLRLPRTYGVQGLFGFDLGPRDRSVMLGLAVAQLYAVANDQQDALSETFFGLGGGFRFAD